jgi:hypothetical protein
MALNLREQADRQLAFSEGRAEGRAEIIKALLQDGRTPEEIQMMIHLPLNEIKEVEASLCATK